MSAQHVVDTHRRAGHGFEAGGVGSFVRDEGDGDAVVLLHGVPASSFLYRKVIAELTGRGLRGLAFDLPGLGLADRPTDFDYSWTGLGRFALAAVEALELDRFHLVVHDIGGPVGFELAARAPDRVRTLTLLNTIIDVASFRKPLVMRPFGSSLLGPLWLKTMVKPVFRQLMYNQGVEDAAAVTSDELDAWLLLLKGSDGGRAFLRIMQSFETTDEKQALYRRAVRDGPYPVQVVWGARDPALTYDRFGREALEATGLERAHTVNGKHFLQEDCAPEIAELISRHAARAP